LQSVNVFGQINTQNILVSSATFNNLLLTASSILFYKQKNWHTEASNHLVPTSIVNTTVT